MREGGRLCARKLCVVREIEKKMVAQGRIGTEKVTGALDWFSVVSEFPGPAETANSWVFAV